MMSYSLALIVCLSAIAGSGVLAAPAGSGASGVVAPPASSVERCARCNFTNGVGFLSHDNCHQYIQCQDLGGGNYREHEMFCAHGLYWSQTVLTCVTEKDQSSACIDGSTVTPSDITQTISVCPLLPGSVPEKFIQYTPSGPVEMDCSAGTVFSQAACTCVHGYNPNPCKDSPMLHFPFATHYNDVSCNKASGILHGVKKFENNAAYFDGNSRVEVGYLKNWFADNEVKAMTVALCFKSNGNNNFQGLFTNGDCVDDASLRLAIENGVAQGQIIADTTATFDGTASTSRQFQHNTWIHVAMVKTSWDVKYYLNGKQVDQKFVSGGIANTQCASTIGFSGLNNKENYFQGYMKDVRVYKKTLFAFDIGQLADDCN